MKTLLALFIAALAAVPAAHGAGNLVVNPGFEEHITDERIFSGWEDNVSSGTIEIAWSRGRNAHGGRNMAHIILPFGNRGTGVLGQRIQIREAGVYTARAWVRRLADGGSLNARMRVFVLGPTTESLAVIIPASQADQWRQIEIKDIKVPADEGYDVDLSFFAFSNNASSGVQDIVDIDDVEFFNQDPTPSPPQNLRIK